MWHTHLCEVQDLEDYLQMTEESSEDVKHIVYASDSHQVILVTKDREVKISPVLEALFAKKSE